MNGFQFQTQSGSFEEMEAVLRAVVWSSAELWSESEAVQLELRTTFVNPVLHLSSCSREGTGVELGARERALVGHITRFYRATFGGLTPVKKRGRARSFVATDESDWQRNNPFWVLSVQAPTMHEKMEAMETLREWLRAHWPDGARHLARVV